MNHSDIYDPLNRINVPPSRHAVESDSEDDDDDQDDSEIDPSGQDTSQEDVQFQSLSTSEASLQGQEVIVLAGPVGEALSNYSAVVEVARLIWKGRPQASMAQQEGSPSTLLMLLYPSNVLVKRYSSLSAFLEHLLKQLKPTSLRLVSQYHPSLYNGSASDDVAPIRFLASQSSRAPPGVAPYLPPNYLWGTEASLLQAATLQSIPTDALLVPNHGPSLQPQNRLVRSTKRRRQVKSSVNPLADGGSMLADEPASSAGHHDGSLSADFDDDELEEEEADPEPRLQDLDDGDIAGIAGRLNDVLRKSGSEAALTPAARASASSGQGLAAFVQARRSQAHKRRKDLGGMYI